MLRTMHRRKTHTGHTSYNKIDGFRALYALLTRYPQLIVQLHIQPASPRGAQLIALAQQQSIVYQAADVSYALTRPLPELAQSDLDNALQAHRWRRLLVADGVTDTRNIGACIRSAYAFGVDAVVLPRNNAAAITQASYQASAGALVFVPIVRVNNIGRALAAIATAALPIIGTVCDSSAPSLSTLVQCDTFALVIGSEDKGITKRTKKLCDQLVYIPMHDKNSSLNVSVATGIALYQLTLIGARSIPDEG